MATPFPSFTKKWHNTSYSSISPTRPELSMKDKSVVITGGGTGIGASITRAFAAAGSTELAIIGRRENVLRETAAAAEAAYPGAKVLTFVADVSKANTVQAAFDGIVKSYGRIDICISNAGFLPRVESIMESDLDDWWMSFETNVKGSYNIARAFLHHANPGSVLIDTSTCIVSMPPVLKGHSAYAASKIAGAKLHEYIANEHPDIHVASMHPGVVATDMSEKSGFPGLDNISLPSNFAVWLASDEAKFLRGKLVYCNWDVEELVARKEEIAGDEELLTLVEAGVSHKGWTIQQTLDYATASSNH